MIHILFLALLILPGAHQNNFNNTANTKKASYLADTARNVFINIEAFGAVANDGKDDSKAIQAAIDYATSNPAAKDKTVYFPAGVFDISNTIHAGYGDNFSSVVLLGSGAPYDPGSTTMKGATIKANFSDRPAINIQGARKSRIEGIAIIGINSANAGYGRDMLEETNYIIKGLNANADNRYAPYAAITIDAYSGTPQKISYTNAPKGWNKKTSSVIDIIDCKITNFVAGIVSHPSGSDGNGDFINIDRCLIQYCKYGVSISQSQSRLVNILRSQIDVCWKLLVTDTHGMQNGRISRIESCHFSGFKVLSLANTAWNGPLVIIGCYGESLHSLGFFGPDRTNASPVTFLGCDFNFNHKEIGVVPLYIGHGNEVKFESCRLTGLSLDFILIKKGIFSNTKFCYTYSNLPDLPTYRKMMFYSPFNIGVRVKKVVDDCEINLSDYGLSYNYDGDSAKVSKEVGLTNLENFLLKGLDLSFKITGAPGQMSEGDLLYFKHTGARFMIEKKTGNQYKAKLLNGYKYAGSNFEGYTFNDKDLYPTGDFTWYQKM